MLKLLIGLTKVQVYIQQTSQHTLILWLTASDHECSAYSSGSTKQRKGSTDIYQVPSLPIAPQQTSYCCDHCG